MATETELFRYFYRKFSSGQGGSFATGILSLLLVPIWINHP
jgi:hypothetical protein